MTKFISDSVKKNGKKIVAGPRANTGREDRTMGVEIEFFGARKDDVIAALRSVGIHVAWEGYTHRTVRHWKLVYDSSVTGRGTGVSHGLELVSPPLTESEMVRELKVVCEVLDQIGAKVDRTCGIHVHHHIDDFTVENVKNIYKLYSKHQLAIEAILPQSRRGASQPTYCKEIKDHVLERVEVCRTIRDVALSTGRYYTINMRSYVKYGTVEFRQHSGSTDYTKIMNWIKITQAIVATAKKKKSIRMTGVSKTITHQNYSMLHELNLRETEQAAYFMTRKDSFKELNEEAHNRAAV